MKINREAWRMIEIVVKRYPENKAEYENALEDLMGRKGGEDGMPRSEAVGNPTERIAIKLADNPRLSRIAREVNAVESVYNKMLPEHQRVIRVRFWSYRYSKMKYFDMERCTSYRERQMHRIVHKFFLDVGRNLGEI